MGKHSTLKSKPNGRASGSMQDYFPQNSSPTTTSMSEKQTAKMMPTLETEVGETDSAAVTHKYLFDLRNDLKQHFTSLLDQKLEPFSKRLSSLTTMVKDVSSTADAAYDLSKFQEQHIKNLQLTEKRLKE